MGSCRGIPTDDSFPDYRIGSHGSLRLFRNLLCRQCKIKIAYRNQDQASSLTIAMLGILLHWILWIRVCYRRYHGRCVEPEEPCLCLRFHVISVHHYSICGTKGRRHLLLQYLMAVGIRCLGNNHTSLRCASIHHDEIQSLQGPEGRISGQKT